MIKEMFTVYKIDMFNTRTPVDTFMSYDEAADFIRYYLERAKTDPLLDPSISMGIEKRFKLSEEFVPLD